MDPKSSISNISTDVNAFISFQYETQHFGFHPHTFIDRVYNEFFDTIISSLAQMKQHMIEVFKDVMPANAIKGQTDILLQDIVKQLDKSIDKLEVYLGVNVFSVENNVVFPEDKIHIKAPCTEEDDKKVDAEIEELKYKILMEKAKKSLLKKQICEQKEFKKDLLSLQNKLKTWLSIANQENVTLETIDLLFSYLNKLMELNVLSL